ncbi:MAG: two-component regulator propeller domain-containing protein [Melioribacteraceae bacterium]
MIKKISILISYFTIGFLICSFQVSAQNLKMTSSDFRFLKIGIEEGLSQSTVLSILQDQRGYLWFGTANGLNRFDGYEFVVYNNITDDSSSISDNEITSLYEDNDGFIWIGTAKGILNKFNPKTETFKHFDIASSSDWYLIDEEKFYNYPLTLSRNQNSTITAIDQDIDGNLWIGTWGKGLIKFHPKTHQKKYLYHFPNRINSLSSNKIVKVFVDSKGIIWVGTFGGGLNKIINTENSQIKIFNKNIYPENFLKIGEKITSISEDSENNLIVAEYSNGIFKIASATKEFSPNRWEIVQIDLHLEQNFNSPNIMAVCSDNYNNLWIGTYGNGLLCYNEKLKTTIQYLATQDPNSLSENEIQSIYVDNSNIVWVGTQLGKGINKIESNKNNFKTIPVLSSEGKSINDNIIWSIFEDSDKNLWIGTYRGGLNKIDFRTNEFKYFGINEIGDFHIRSIIEDYKGNLWIGTFSNGLTFFDRNKNTFTNFKMSESNKSLKSNQIQSMFIDEDSTLYIGTFGGGLSQLTLKDFYNKSIIEFTTYQHNPSDIFSISDDRVYSIYVDKKNEFWLGTHGGGINHFDRRTKIFTNYKSDNNFLNDNRIMKITEAKDGKFLVGTFGGGLNLFDPKLKTFTNINKKSGIDCNDVYGIFDDNISGYWLSTNNGIYKLEYDLKSFVRYGLLDGLQSLEFNGGSSFQTKSGIIYFGGINGINYFDPKEIKIDKYIAPIVITKIKLFDKVIKGEKKELIFEKDQNYFSFEFASLDFKKSGKNKYKYILEGLDKQWTYTNAANRKVYYTNLAPGEYKFIVTGTNNDGIWSSQFASVKITILTPFWMQWWFISLLILLIGGIITFLINQRIRYLIAMDKLKSNLSADLHDNVGAGLTEISILSELTATEVPDTSNVSKNLIKISELSRQLVESMSDIVWVVNPNRDSLYDLIVRLKDSYAELLGELGITLQSSDLEKLADIKMTMDIRQNLYLILKESINNCIKHSNCKNIDLKIIQSGKNMNIEVIDDGNGFNINSASSGNGLTNIKQRASKINWQILIKSEIGSGTKVILEGRI